jgi:hypothetical protein
MHGDVDFAGKQRVLDLFRKKALAADIRQWPVGNPVARSFDDCDRDIVLAEPVGFGKPVADFMGLGER